MGRIYSSNSRSNASTSQLNQVDNAASDSTTGAQSHFANRAEEIASFRSILERVNQFIRNIDREMMTTNDGSWNMLRDNAINLKNEVTNDLRCRLNGQDPVSYSDSRDYAARLNSILDNHQPPSRQGYHPTSIAFDFSQSSHPHSSSDSD